MSVSVAVTEVSLVSPMPRHPPDLLPWFVSADVNGDASGGTATLSFDIRAVQNGPRFYVALTHFGVWTDDITGVDVDCSIAAQAQFPDAFQVFGSGQMQASGTANALVLVTPDRPLQLGQHAIDNASTLLARFGTNTNGKDYHLTARGWLGPRPFIIPGDVI